MVRGARHVEGPARGGGLSLLSPAPPRLPPPMPVLGAGPGSGELRISEAGAGRAGAWPRGGGRERATPTAAVRSLALGARSKVTEGLASLAAPPPIGPEEAAGGVPVTSERTWRRTCAGGTGAAVKGGGVRAAGTTYPGMQLVGPRHAGLR